MFLYLTFLCTPGKSCSSGSIEPPPQPQTLASVRFAHSSPTGSARVLFDSYRRKDIKKQTPKGVCFVMYPREILLLRLYRASTAAADPRFRSLCSLFSHRERSGSVRFLPEKRYKKTNAKRRLFCYVPPVGIEPTLSG